MHCQEFENTFEKYQEKYRDIEIASSLTAFRHIIGLNVSNFLKTFQLTQ